MRRADRLFRILQILRARDVTTAAHLAERLEVSERTIYRDVQDLVASGVPIDGEAGVGYVLAESFDLPPLMFTTDEVEALVLGTRIVEQWGDDELGRAARSVLEKVTAVLPDHAKERLDSPLFSVSFAKTVEVGRRLTLLREAIRDRRMVRFLYPRSSGVAPRTVRPICLTLMMSAWLLSGWCELRRDFRTFRLDAMEEATVLDETFEHDESRGLNQFLRHVAAQRDGESEV